MILCNQCTAREFVSGCRLERSNPELSRIMNCNYCGKHRFCADYKHSSEGVADEPDNSGISTENQLHPK